VNAATNSPRAAAADCSCSQAESLRATCDVIVLSPDLANERVRFRLQRCLPARITGPALDAAKNEIAIETLEIACEGIEIVRPGEKARATPRPAARAQLRELDVEETLEAFSPDGRPLRASLALALGREQVTPYAFGATRRG
jgi:hypothetical protein